MDCSLPGSSIHGILQARILEWVAISPWDLPDPGNQTYVLCLPRWQVGSLRLAPPGKTEHVCSAICKMDHQQGPSVKYRELCSMLCGNLDGKGVWGRMPTCTWMAGSLCSSPETITTLLISYTPIQNKKFKKKWHKRKESNQLNIPQRCILGWRILLSIRDCWRSL